MTLPVVGWLNSGASSGREHLLAAFRRGLIESGQIEGQSLAICSESPSKSFFNSIDPEDGV
jgi:hypothetical protein